MLPDVLNVPVVFKLPPVMLPVTDTMAPVKLATFTMLVNIPLLPVTLPDKETNAPVKLATFTMLVNEALLAVTLPVKLNNPPVKLAAFTMVVARTLLATTLPDVLRIPVVFRLPPWMLPVVLRLVPVAAPMLGVVSVALDLTTMLPVPSNAVVVLSTLALNTVPVNDRPAEVLAL